MKSIAFVFMCLLITVASYPVLRRSFRRQKTWLELLRSFRRLRPEIRHGIAVSQDAPNLPTWQAIARRVKVSDARDLYNNVSLGSELADRYAHLQNRLTDRESLAAVQEVHGYWLKRKRAMVINFFGALVELGSARLGIATQCLHMATAAHQYAQSVLILEDMTESIDDSGRTILEDQLHDDD